MSEGVKKYAHIDMRAHTEIDESLVKVACNILIKLFQDTVGQIGSQDKMNIVFSLHGKDYKLTVEPLK